MSYSGQKILLVDDDQSLRELYNVAFRLNGINFSMAAKGIEAIEKIKVDKPDLILLDLMLPDLSGFGVLKLLKKDPETADIKVWMITNLAEDVDREQAQSLGAEDYLVKSNYTPKQVIEKIKDSL